MQSTVNLSTWVNIVRAVLFRLHRLHWICGDAMCV
nr:MAG TPA: hypothetical protein [Caudoviricetes sp.]